MFDEGSAFIVAVNYWPRQSGQYWWKRFDAAVVDNDFGLMTTIGISCVRIFLLWEDFQPTPDKISQTALQDLKTVADLAHKHALLLDVTFFTGHMSGPNWIPDWMLLLDEPKPSHVTQVISGGRILSCGYRNMYTDEFVLQAEELQIASVVSVLKDHPAVSLYNLANEPDLVAIPNSTQALEWVCRMRNAVLKIDGKAKVICGYHSPSLSSKVGFELWQHRELASSVIHGYPMYAFADKWVARHELDMMFVPFLASLSAHLSGKKCFAEEFGGPTQPPNVPSGIFAFPSYGSERRQFMVSEDDFADYLEKVLKLLHKTGAAGAGIWCWSDYSEELFNLPPLVESVHERNFGILRSDGSLKPHAFVLKRFMDSKPKILSIPYSAKIDCSVEEFYADPRNQSQRLFEKYLAKNGDIE